MTRWRQQLIRWILVPALLHLVLTPLSSAAWAASSSRWSPAAERALLRVLEHPDQAWALQLSTRDGRILKGRLAAWRTQSDSLYQRRLDAWAARDAERLLLPRLGGELILANRYQAGKPLRGRFYGVAGPVLLLEQGGRLRPMALAGLELQSAVGRWLVRRESLDRLGDWPPSRSLLDLRDPSGTSTVPLDDVLDLRAESDWLGLGLLALPMVLMAWIYWELSHTDVSLWHWE